LEEDDCDAFEVQRAALMKSRVVLNRVTW